MDIRNVKELKAFSAQRLENAPAQKRIVLIYAGTMTLMAVLVTLIQFLLGQQIGQTGGLGGLGLRSVLSAAQLVLPMVESMVAMCLGLGYLASMLRVARGQYVSPQTLRLGFDRFWPLLRLTLIESILCIGLAMAALYASTFLFLMTPLSRGAMELLMPLVSQTTVLDPNLLLDEGLYYQLTEALMPVVWIFLAVFLLAAVPVLFRYRLAEYVLIDRPGLGALAAMRESRKMLRRNCMNLLRVDLSLWWYYAAVLAATVIGYGDQLLPLIGVALPWSATVSYYVFYGLYQVLQLLVCLALRNRVETTYALAYDSLRPKEQPGSGVVLGNIFQM